MNSVLENSYNLPLLTGSIFIIASIIIILFPPKKINLLYGYRTPSSMKNQANWDFAQKYAANKMMLTGFLLVVFSCCKFLFGEKYEMLLSFAALFLAVLFLFFLTERAIKNKFKENVN